MPYIIDGPKVDAAKLHLDRFWQEVFWRRENEQKITIWSIGFFGVLLTIVYSSDIQFEWYQGVILILFPLIFGSFASWYLYQNAKKNLKLFTLIADLNDSMGAWEKDYLVLGKVLYPEQWKNWGSTGFWEHGVSRIYLVFLILVSILSAVGIAVKVSMFIFQQPVSNPLWLDIALTKVILPVVVAVVTYLLVYQLGEWRKRRANSRLGSAIIESLKEEVRNGIAEMNRILNVERIHNIDNIDRMDLGELPHKSWSGMNTISDEVFLRIIETSAGGKFEGFLPRDCRNRCKDYFDHVCSNYNRQIIQSIDISRNDKDWRVPIRELCVNIPGYIKAAEGVYQMLDDAQNLLEHNAKARFPK